MDGLITPVTVGKSGVWGVGRSRGIYFREDVTPDTPYGWRHLDGELEQIDAGSSGVVYGVNGYLFLLLFGYEHVCRICLFEYRTTTQELVIFQGFCRWKLPSVNLNTFIRPKEPNLRFRCSGLTN